MSENRDRLLDRYRWAVQDPQRQAAALVAIFERVRRRPPRQLREDFCGNGADSVAFVAAARGRNALAIDHDPATVEQGRARAQRLLGARAAAIDWRVADVHALGPAEVCAADLLAVLNFSIGYLHSRAALLHYLRHARRCVGADGVLVVNTFGGPEALRPHRERSRIQPGRERGAPELAAFDYEWETRSFDAARARIDCRIHFEWQAADGPQRAEDAFVYDWRLWSPPELIEAFVEAGFRRARVWRHTLVRGRDGPRGWLRPVRSLRDAPQWTAYVVGEA